MSRSRQPRPNNKTTFDQQTAINWLSGDQHGASVLTTARMLLTVEQATKQVLPPALAQVYRVARIEKQQVTLAVPSAAYAARLRQLAPRIVQLLTREGWNLNEITVRVQASLLQSQTKTPPKKEAVPLDKTALNAFEDLHNNLNPGPLADAVARLLSHHRHE